MTVTSTPDLIQYTAGAGMTIFAYPFGILEDADLKVYQTPQGTAFDPNTQLLTLNTEYTVQSSGNPNGGTITLTTGATLNDLITIDGDLIVNRTTDFGQSFLASQINSALDRLTMYARNQKTEFDSRGIHYQIGDVIGDGENIFPKLSAGQFVKKAESGTSLVAATIEENPDVSTLRSDLSSETLGGDGSRLIGYNNSPTTAATTLHDFLVAQEVLISQISASLPITGSVRFGIFPLAPSGWIIAAGNSLSAPRTIGNSSSGANVRANSDTEDLFVLLWNSYNDTIAPVSGGRGTSGSDDFNANKTLQIPDYAGRVSGVAGNGSSLTSRSYDSLVGSETHTLSKAEIPPHTHEYNQSADSTSQVFTGTLDFFHSYTTENTENGSSDGLAGNPHNNIQPSFFLDMLMKL